MVVDLEPLLRCPISKQPMEPFGPDYLAPAGFRYRDGDFRVSLDWSPRWEAGQVEYERWVDELLARYDGDPALMETTDAELVDVYAATDLPGLVLDVGGYPGIVLRHAAVPPDRYVSIDPIRLDPGRLKRLYPRFVSRYDGCTEVSRIQGVAEFLPLADLSFDTVHMRSCIDHFAAPQVALKEAYRVLRFGGKLVVGIALEGAFRKETAAGGSVAMRSYRTVATTLRERAPRLASSLEGALLWRRPPEDHHIFHPTHDALVELLRGAGFTIANEVWQASFHNVIYVDARKPAPPWRRRRFEATAGERVAAGAGLGQG